MPVADGIVRVTFPLPLGIDHVHCYLVRGTDGAWTLVDTGLGLPGAEARWTPVVAALDGPIERIVITHYHPDHIGGAADVAELTGASVYQGSVDHEQTVEVWGDIEWPLRVEEWLLAHGTPREDVERTRAPVRMLAGMIHYVAEPELLHAGDRLDGWEVVHLPGHADGHIALLREGVILAGDSILDTITPTVGLYPSSRPDPLADYLGSLARLAALAPALALAGHGPPIERVVERARQILDHHRDRLARTGAALTDEPRSAYEVSLALFEPELDAIQRRFAVVETLAHLERLANERAAVRVDVHGLPRYMRAP